ncbi:hypothetical protein AGR4B_pAt20003 [Agrobacterium tumefaciens str. CFBP 5621]|nr:hypothetical protein AGR4B_pAt20003 [Agrobacterium tumefaciens str. CFBP 5621]
MVALIVVLRSSAGYGHLVFYQVVVPRTKSDFAACDSDRKLPDGELPGASLSS